MIRLNSYRRVAYSPLGSATQTATIKLGRGDWEITGLSVIMGGKIPALNGAEFGGGDVSFEAYDTAGDMLERHFLLAGRCTAQLPMVMDSPKRVVGPGRIISSLEHGQSSEHTLAAIYRRIRD